MAMFVSGSTSSTGSFGALRVNGYYQDAARFNGQIVAHANLNGGLASGRPLFIEVNPGNEAYLGIRQADYIYWSIGQEASDTNLYFRSGNVGADTARLTLTTAGNATFGGTINSGAITSTAGISGTTGTFTGNILSSGANAKISGSSSSTGSFGQVYTAGKSYLGDDVRLADGKTLLLGTNGGDIEWLSEGGTRRGKIASLGDGIAFYAGQSDVEIFSLPHDTYNCIKMIGATNIIWETDSGGDIGASGATRPRDLFVARNAIISGKVGLETTSPDAHLHISSSSTMGSSTASLHIEGSGSSVVAVDGTQGRLFSVTDEMSGSIFSANTIAGLPVIEAFSDNRVNLGPFSSPVHIDSSGKVGIGISNPTHTLHVDAGGSNNTLFYLGHSGTSGLKITAANDHDVEIDSKGSSGDMQFFVQSGRGFYWQGKMVPWSNATYDLGTTAASWRNIYATGNISSSATSTGSFGKIAAGVAVPAATLYAESSTYGEPVFYTKTTGDAGVGYIANTMEYADSAINSGGTILHLDFSSDSTIASQHDYIRFSDHGGEVGTISAEVTYNEFTGAHISQRPSGSSFSNWKKGMIVKSTGNLVSTGSAGISGSAMSTAWVEVDLTTSQKDKAVMGVFDVTGSAPHQMKYLDRDLPTINYNAIGEGRIRVTDTNGNIDVGDYICSSARTGHGEKQDEVYLANFTIAKATQPYNFTSASNDADLGYKSVLIACTYHCG